MINIDIAFSPCPNDTFIFDALVHKKIDTENFIFTPVLEDVQTLNEWAKLEKYPVTKISYGVLPHLLGKYKILDAGSALGQGVGPLVIARNDDDFSKDLSEETVAIPGENTTAHFLFNLAYPLAKKKIFLRYDAIEAHVQQGKGPGVIIHENRFTYADRGFQKLSDLGSHWEKQTGNPIPLGGIVVTNNFEKIKQQKIDGFIKKSIAYAFNQLPVLSNFITCNAQEMTEKIMRQHIDLYVNEYSLSLGETGRSAIIKLLKVAGVAQENLQSEKLFV